MIQSKVCLFFFGLLLCPLTLFAGQPLETETARLLPAKNWELENTFEFQTSSEGQETAVPVLIEYGLSRRFELAVEPVLQANISPKAGKHASGIGDLEITLTYLLASEKRKWPALAFAAETKIPTAKDRLIGSGEIDYTVYVIASKRFHTFDTHFNAGYAILGEPTGVILNNIFSFATAVEWHVSPKWDWVIEGFANTSATPEANGSEEVSNSTSPTAELAGGEAFAMIGSRWHISAVTTFAMGIVYDNSNALLIRPGITVQF